MPAGQTFVADANGRGQGKGKDPGEARFWPGPDCAGLCVASGSTGFGAGLGQAGFWVSPTAEPWSWPSVGTQLACPGTAPYPVRPRADNDPWWVLSLTGSDEAADCFLPFPVSLGRGCLGIGEPETVSACGETPRAGGGAPIVSCAKC